MEVEKGKIDVLQNCMLCPRVCGVDRSKGERGICGQTADLRLARAALHMWEEPCISGTKGSGAIFFSGCALHCVFCQNRSIASGETGRVVSVERLAEIMLELENKGANNINLVTAGQFAPQVKTAIDIAKKHGLHIPIIYNTSAYESVETLRSLEGYVDVYLPDLKYVNAALSDKYSHAKNYFEKASMAIEEMVRQTGELRFTDEETMEEKLAVSEYQEKSEQGEVLLITRGVIVRHLLLPGAVLDSKAVIHYLLQKYGERIFISIMNQYTPLPHVNHFEELKRKVTPAEYEEVVAYAIAQGIENGFIQEGDVAEESFIPEFDYTGI